MARLLGRVRLSRLTDETTSPARQRQVIEQYAEMHGHEVVGWAVDLDVSRSVDPFASPELSPWLSEPERVDTWDVVACWKLDRIATGSIHLNKLMEWCQSQENEKTLISVTESFDLGTWVGRLIANLIAGVAEGELAAIQERTKGSYDYNIREGKFRGGHPPFGYMPYKQGNEWKLEPYPETKDLLLWIINQVLDDVRPYTIVQNLNSKIIPTPQDYFRKFQGKPMKGSSWRVSALIRSLRSPTVLGQTVHRPVTGRKNGKPVYGESGILRDDAGAPVVRAEPLITQDTFDRLQKKLDGMAGQRVPYKRSNNLLLRVIECGVCNNGMYLTGSGGTDYWYYRCSSRIYKEPCGNRSLRKEQGEDMVQGVILAIIGDVERLRKVWEPGDDPSTELAEVDAELTDIAGLIGTGPFREGPARDKIEARAEALSKRRDNLADKSVRRAGYRYEPTGQTFRQHWESLDIQGKNRFLREHDVKLVFAKGGQPEFDLTLGDLPSLVSAVDPDKGQLVKDRMSRVTSGDAREMEKQGGTRSGQVHP